MATKKLKPQSKIKPQTLASVATGSLKAIGKGFIAAQKNEALDTVVEGVGNVFDDRPTAPVRPKTPSTRPQQAKPQRQQKSKPLTEDKKPAPGDMPDTKAKQSPVQKIEDKVGKATKQDVQAAARWLWNIAGTKLRKANVSDDTFKPRIRDNVFIGGMFIYEYDPKHKDTLPWYDTVPVVIPVELYDDGWLGLNLHYLHPKLRAILMDKLMEFRRRALTRKAYMNVTYKLLSAVVRTDLFAPCVHRYLASHVASKVLRIDDSQWETVAMLPLQRFVKASASQVWNNTQKRYKKRKK